MPAELDALLTLQAKDQAATAIRQEIAAFTPEMGELDQAVADAERAVATARGDVTDAGGRRVALEEKIENFKAMQERKRQRLEWVRGAKEASNLMAELDLGRSVLAKEEAEWVRTADRVQEAEAEVAEAERLLQEVRDGQTARREEIAARVAAAEERLQVAERERAEAAAQVPQRWRRLYERILTGRAPLALYPLRAAACGHCFTAVPKHRRQELLNGEQVISCEVCGVLVYEEAAAES